MTDMNYRVSVVVPTFRRPDLLQCCLSALTLQNIDPADFEILIIDDAACDDTMRQVECWIERARECGHTIRYLQVVGSHGPAAARNLGWRAANGEIIAFTDDDCLPIPGWLRAGLAAFHDGVIGVSGKIIVPLEHTPTDYERNAALLAKAEFVTANCFYRRDALSMVGGFDERFTNAWREDSDLVFKLMKRVALDSTPSLVYAPNAVVVHPVRPARWGVSLKQQRKSMFNALLYKKHPALYRQKIQASPPWHYYYILAALLIAVVSAIAGYWLFALGALSIWILMTARFCLLRLENTSHTLSHISEMIVTSIMIPPLAILWRIVGAIKFRVFFL